MRVCSGQLPSPRHFSARDRQSPENDQTPTFAGKVVQGAVKLEGLAKRALGQLRLSHPERIGPKIPQDRAQHLELEGQAGSLDDALISRQCPVELSQRLGLPHLLE
jgi:hypothetical protein